MYRIAFGHCPRACWFAGWIDEDETIPGTTYREQGAETFCTRREAEDVAARFAEFWCASVEEG